MTGQQELINVSGRIFDIQRFSVHDGPGIRTIVFFKGCRLRCKWCCNPESQRKEIEYFNRDDGTKTVTGRDVTAGEVMETVARDEAYYRRSGGGMTLSGGEFLLQPEFAKALLMLARMHGINTAVETTSFADFGVIEELLPHIDHYLMDIKHMDSLKHREYTGVNNELILENARKVAKIKNNFVVRVPVIPKFNDTEREISQIAEFAAKIGAKRLHLLPYHRLGQDKYRWLSRNYELGDILPPENEKMQQLLKSAEKFGIDCQIGG